MRFLQSLLFILSLCQVQAQLHIPVLSELTGNDLLDELVNEYKPDTVLDYGDARDLMYGTIYNENDSVSCVYSGHSLFLPEDVDPSTFLYMNGIADGINCEHTYPRSKGADESYGNGYSDMHHLFPSRASVNSARSNFPFAEINDNETSTWYYLNQSQSNTPTTNIDLYSEKVIGEFEPREDHKGNVARAVFYFFTMYRDDALDADPDFFELQRETLCAWHRQDPVDSLEWERTFMIGQYQNELPNPFILDSTLVSRTYCEEVLSIKKLEQPKVLIYPNPANDIVTVSSEGNNILEVMDVFGRKIAERQFSNSIQLDISDLKPGSYFFKVNDRVFMVLIF